MSKAPRIIVLSTDDADTFDWLSDGWNCKEVRGNKESETLMDRARQAILSGADVPDAIDKLQKAGFEIIRQKGD